MTLVLKLVLAPLLVVVSSLAGRRWGPGVTGLLVAMPVVAGPIVLITYLEHGPVFAARAASASLLGLVSLAAFAVVFARVGRVRGWLGTVLVGWLVCLALDLALSFAPVPVWAALGMALAAAWAGMRLVPEGLRGTGSASLPALGEAGSPALSGRGEAGSLGLSGLGETGSASLPALGGTGSVSLPVSRETGSASLPGLGEAGSASLPESGETGSASVPVSDGMGSASVPVSGEAGRAAMPGRGAAASLGLPERGEASASSLRPSGQVSPPWWDLPARAIATAGLVLALTAAAGRLGPGLTGVLAPFPTGTSVVAAFALAQGGPAAALATMRGVLRGLRGFAAFCFLVAVLAEPIGGWAFAIAMAGAVIVQWAGRKR
ncbi:hypothetical protein [Amycolatopsis sp. SID8362]|uniref:hypothetical protein n=1 Tax=Amycolatopsis sp. SID8362 TaxID=2690346 RepID=UPI001EF1B161|nr:hypothetical protein [Amycolatopsis sp. SID8362]